MISSAAFEIASFRLGSELIQSSWPVFNQTFGSTTPPSFDTAPVPIARLDDGERDFVARGCFRAIRFSRLQNHGTLYAPVADQSLTYLQVHAIGSILHTPEKLCNRR